MATAKAAIVRPAIPLWKLRRSLPLYLLMLPAIVVMIVFSYWPMYGVLIAFKNYKPLMGMDLSPWVGLLNFQRLVSQPVIWSIFRNTLYIAVGKIIVGQLASLILAVMLHEVISIRYKRVIQNLTYVLNFFSWVIFGGIVVDILGLDGGVNQILAAIGIQRIGFVSDPSIFPSMLIFTDVLKTFGFGAIIYLAALTGVDPTLYESAVTDGANRWQRLWYVTLPSIAPTVVLMACLNLGNVLNAGMDQVLVLQNPQVLSSGEIIDTFVYKMGLINFQYSFATAVGLLKSVIGLVMISLSYFLADRLANYRIF